MEGDRVLWLRVVRSCVGDTVDDSAVEKPPELPAFALDAAPSKRTFQIGEPVWIDVHVVYPEKVAVTEPTHHAQHSSVIWWRRLITDITSPDGNSCRVTLNEGRDFPREPGTIGQTREITARIDLAKVALFDAGTYAVRFTAPGLPDVARDVSVTVALPDDPEAFVHTTLRAVDDRSREVKSDFKLDRHAFEALAHPLFVPILERIATDGGFTATEGVWIPSHRAAYALGAAPGTEATEALLRLDAADPDPKGVISRVLMNRIAPTPTSRPQRTCFVENPFPPDMRAALLARARESLAIPTTDSRWMTEYTWAAQILARIGEPEDGPRLHRALDRAIAMPDVTAEERYDAVEELGLAAQVHPAEGTPVSREAALLVSVMQWDGRSWSAPPGREEVTLRALASDDPDVYMHMIGRLPHDPPPAVVAAVLPYLGSPNMWVHRRVVGVLSSRTLDSSLIVDPARRELAGPPSPQTDGILHVLSMHLPMDEWLDLVLVEVRADPTDTELAWDLLRGIDCPHPVGPLNADDVPALVAAWGPALRTQRARLREGPLTIVPGVTDPALVPASYSCTLPTGETWPSR
jgi:hypothetical protein